MIENKALFDQSVLDVKKSAKRDYADEVAEAYVFAKDLGITTTENIDNANMEGNMIRSHMAKMISNYAIKVLKTPVDT